MSKATFAHYIITRFDYEKDNPLYKSRLELFNTVTMRSVWEQTNQNFTWVIITPHPLAADIPLDVIRTNWAGYRKMIADVKADYVITTRLDSDDIWHPEFIDEIQAAFKPETFLIDTPGYRMNLNTKEVVEFNYYSDKRCSPFATLVHPPKGIKSGVMNYKHGDLQNHYPLHRIEKRLWCQVIHDTNMLMTWNLKEHTAPCDKPDWILT